MYLTSRMLWTIVRYVRLSYIKFKWNLLYFILYIISITTGGLVWHGTRRPTKISKV